MRQRRGRRLSPRTRRAHADPGAEALARQVRQEQQALGALPTPSASSTSSSKPPALVLATTTARPCRQRHRHQVEAPGSLAERRTAARGVGRELVAVREQHAAGADRGPDRPSCTDAATTTGSRVSRRALGGSAAPRQPQLVGVVVAHVPVGLWPSWPCRSHDPGSERGEDLGPTSRAASRHAACGRVRGVGWRSPRQLEPHVVLRQHSSHVRVPRPARCAPATGSSAPGTQSAPGCRVSSSSCCSPRAMISSPWPPSAGRSTAARDHRPEESRNTEPCICPAAPGRRSRRRPPGLPAGTPLPGLPPLGGCCSGPAGRRGQRLVRPRRLGHGLALGRDRQRASPRPDIGADEDRHGLHHITMITGDARKNVAFYADVLGLRLVKKTVNFDAPEAYHLYFGDEQGAPGSILTWFEFAGAGRGRAGPRRHPHHPARGRGRRRRSTSGPTARPTATASARERDAALRRLRRPRARARRRRRSATRRCAPSTPRSRPSTRSSASRAPAPTPPRGVVEEGC